MKIIEATTIKELPEKIKSIQLPPETPIRVIIEKIQVKTTNKTYSNEKKLNYLFLNDELWEGENTPEDLAMNHDHYLYD